MAIVILQAPPAVAAAFNEIPLVVQTPKARYDQLTQDLAKATTAEQRIAIQNEMNSLSEVRNQATLEPMTFVAVIGNDPALNRTVTLTPEVGPDGTAYVDLSYIMRRAFVNITRVFAPSAEFDYNLVAQGYIDDGGTPKASFHALNAVGQPGYYNSAEGFTSYAKLSNTPLIRYDGYPLLITFRLPLNSSNSISYTWEHDGVQVAQGALLYPIGNLLWNPRESDVTHLTIRFGSAGNILGEYSISEGCVPDAPFYVRWINASGGWNSWMFERRTETDEVEDANNIQLYIADPTDTQQTVSLNAARTVTVGEGLLSKDDYRILAALPRSPRIQWYNEELNTWQTIVIAESFSATWNTRNGFGNVEFTFAMPRLLTQF